MQSKILEDSEREDGRTFTINDFWGPLATFWGPFGDLVPKSPQKVPKRSPKVPKGPQRSPKIPKDPQRSPKIPWIPKDPQNFGELRGSGKVWGPGPQNFLETFWGP